jgi:SPP1 family predicted phage head-tail adaptor
MRAGRLRHRVRLQRSTQAPDAVNDPVLTWSDLATVWAQVEPLAGREFFAAQQVQTAVSHRITLRYRAGITPKDRVAWLDPATRAWRYFDINAVLDRDEKHRQLDLMVTEHG